MYWFILLFPLMIYPWGYDPYYTQPKVAYLEIFVLLYWLYIIIKKKYWTIDMEKPYANVDFLVAAFMLLVVLSTILSVNVETALYGAKYRYEGVLTIFSYSSIFLFSYRLMDSKKVKELFTGMAMVSILVSIYGILQHFQLDFLPRNSTKLSGSRSYSFFDNPNFFGSYLVLIILLTIGLYLVENSRKLSAFYFTAISINFIALIFSGTRSGYVGVILGIILLSVFAIFKGRFLLRKWGTLLLTLGIIFLVINVTEDGNHSKRLNTVVTDSLKLASKENVEQVGSYRFFIWEKSFPLIGDYFWIGSGPDTLEYVFPKDADTKKIFKDAIVDKAHNEYLHMAITLGVPALLIYLSLLAVVLFKALSAVKIAEGNEKIFLICLQATIIGYLAQAFFNISVVPVAPLFWALLGITLARSELALKKHKSQKLNDEPANIYQTA